MPSLSLRQWQTQRRRSLDDLSATHRLIGGANRGRRWATGHINQAYVLAISSQFQGFCRDLHTECADHLANAAGASFQPILHRLLIEHRKLDAGNPNPGNIGADFGRFGLEFWPRVSRLDKRNSSRQRHLERLNDWRNAIAHQSFSRMKLGTNKLTPTLVEIRQWRSSCVELARAFERVMWEHLNVLIGAAPW
jgi:hypothetical protein